MQLIEFEPKQPLISEPATSIPLMKPISSSPSPKSYGFMPVFKNRRFLILWSGQIFSQLADKVYLVLIISIIARRFQQADQPISGWVSAVMVAFTIPAVLFGSLAGVYVDRWSKKLVLVVSNLARGVLVLGLPLFLWLSGDMPPFMDLPIGFWIILTVTLLVSTLTQFFAPAEQATIPLIIKRRHLLAANSLYTTTMMALLIIGFAVGEPLLAIADKLVAPFNWTFGKELVVGASYAIAGLILLFLKTGEKQEPRRKEQPHVFQDIWDGICYLRENYRVRNALIQLVILFSVFAALAVLAVRLAETIPEMKAEQFGILLASGGLGLACGAALLGSWGQRFSHVQLSMYGSIGVAASLIGLSLSTKQLWLALLMTTLLGAFAALVGVPMQTTIQAETPPDMRGKVFGLQNNAVNIALSLPLALAGIAETYLGLRLVFLGLAAMVIAGGLLTWYFSNKKPEISTKVDKSGR
jgi:MFS family permease